MKTQIQNQIVFNRNIEDVFDFVAILGLWTQWHPATLSVSGQKEKPAQAGDKVSETVKSAGFKGNVSWVVTKCERPFCLGMETTSIELPLIKPLLKNVKLELLYTLNSHNGETQFNRDFCYNIPTNTFRLFDWIYLRGHMKSESVTALNSLKDILEK